MKRNKTGRPKFKTTPERRELVEILKCAGFNEDAIAVALDCTGKTLRARFRSELDHGSIKTNARVVVAIFRAAERGNSAAAKLWRQDIVGTEPPRRPRKRPLGKKEIADAASEAAAEGTEWADLIDVSGNDARKVN